MTKTLGLFEAYGIEMEYMIVRQADLGILPVADEILKEAAGGTYAAEVALDELGWSNELVLHVLEIKTMNPMPLAGLDRFFQNHIRRINGMLKDRGGKLLPTGMHPLMNPSKETRLWPHEYRKIYEAFDRIFGCHHHGWANLQSCQINLPFRNNTEFEKLLSAVRFLMPILPALSASSPIAQADITGFMDFRLEAYRNNAAKIPSVTGEVIPEALYSIGDYRTKILEQIYQDITHYDPEGTLRYEWLNARGAIARFDRNAIEIRVLDMQECPAADLAILDAIVRILKTLVSETLIPTLEQKKWSTETLKEQFLECIKNAEEARFVDPRYPELFGFSPKKNSTVKDLWRHLISRHFDSDIEGDQSSLSFLNRILDQGTLARRILGAVGTDSSRRHIQKIYSKLSECLEAGVFFEGV